MLTLIAAAVGKVVLKRPYESWEIVLLACCECTEIFGVLTGYVVNDIKHELSDK